MEEINLVDSPGRTQVFKQAVLDNLDYWQNWLGVELTDIATLDRERQTIVRAISFALDLEGLGWPAARRLIETFSPYMERRGHWEMWRRVLNRAVRVARQVEDEVGLVSLSALLARLLFQQSRVKESIHYYRQTIRAARQIGDQENEARACSNLGYYFTEHGFWDRAEVLCCHALKLFEQLDHLHGRAHTENHLGILYTRQRRWVQARLHLERACAIWQRMPDDHGLMFGLINLGLLYLRMEQPDLALNHLEKALTRAHLTGEERLIGTIYMNMGYAYRLKKDLSQAKSYAQRAENIFRQFSHTIGLAQVWDNLGLVYLYQGDWSDAKSYLNASLEMWRSLKNKKGEIETLVDIVAYELTTKNWAQAKIRLEELETLLDQHTSKREYEYLQPTLEKYRRSLAEH